MEDKIIEELVKLSIVDLAWMAGIIDGECSVAITKGKVYSAQIHLENTDKRIVDYFAKCSERLGIAKKPFTRVDNTKKRQNWKISYVYSVQKFSEVKILLTATLPYLIGKKEQAQKILEWIEYRQNRKLKKDEKGRFLKNYTEEDARLHLDVKKLNNRGNIYGQQ